VTNPAAGGDSLRAVLVWTWISIFLITAPFAVYAIGFAQNAIVPLVFPLLLCWPYLRTALPLAGPATRRLERAVRTGTAGMLIAGFVSIVIALLAVSSVRGATAREYLLLAGLLVSWGGLTAVHVGLRWAAKKALGAQGAVSHSPDRRVLGTAAILLYQVGVLVVASNLLPGLQGSRQEANEWSAVGSLRAIYTAANSYHQEYKNGYPASLAVLAPPLDSPASEEAQATCAAADSIDTVLSSGQKAGYVFGYTLGAPVKEPAPGCPPGVESYTLTARPIVYRTTGTRSFWMDQDGEIHETAEDRSATANDPSINEGANR